MKTTKLQQAPEGGSLRRRVRRFRVRGICLVPTDVEMEIEATSEDEAVKYALSTNWKAHIGGNDGDSASAFDWQPTAEEINTANLKVCRPLERNGENAE